MGFFKNLWNKAKGVLGRVWTKVKDGAKAIAPKIGNVLNTIGDFTGIKGFNMAGGLFNAGKKIYESVSGDGSFKDKVDAVKGGIGDAAEIIRNRPTLDETIDQGKKFVGDQIGKLIVK